MANTLAIRGRQFQLRITIDGKPVKVFTINNFEDNEDAELDSKGYAGAATEVSDRLHKGWMGTFELDVTSSDWEDIEDAVIGKDKARLPGSVINVSKSLTYRDGTQASWVYQNVKLKFGGNMSGRSERVKRKADWRCDSRVKQ